MNAKHSFDQSWARELNLSCPWVEDMAASNVEQKALSLLNAFERAGKQVKRVTVDGRKIELELSLLDSVGEFDGVDMRHGKTRAS